MLKGSSSFLHLSSANARVYQETIMGWQRHCGLAWYSKTSASRLSAKCWLWMHRKENKCHRCCSAQMHEKYFNVWEIDQQTCELLSSLLRFPCRNILKNILSQILSFYKIIMPIYSDVQRIRYPPILPKSYEYFLQSSNYRKLSDANSMYAWEIHPAVEATLVLEIYSINNY